MARKSGKLTLSAVVLCKFSTVQAQWTTGTGDISNTNTGNVGIGTTSPAARLDVQSSAAADLVASMNNSSTTGYGLNILTGGSNGNQYILQASSNSTSRFVVRDNGNVGIGTTSPVEKLEVNGNLIIKAPYASAVLSHPVYTYSGSQGIYGKIVQEDTGLQINSVRWIGAAGIHHSIQFGQDYVPSTGRYAFVIKSDVMDANSPASSVRMLVDLNGNVGIGTTSPIGKFDVRGNAFIGTSDLAIGSSGSFVQIDQGAATGNTYTQIRAFSNGGNAVNNLVLQNSGGSVGIGTTTPSAMLDVAGDVQFGRIGGSSWQFQTPANDMRIVGATSGAHISFIPSGSGNVGIGTTNPDEKLTVAGKVHSREVKVTVDAGADFVFDKSYALRPLSEVENFIDKNKHLPDIAPAAEMKEKGMELGEMNIKLLQKVE